MSITPPLAFFCPLFIYLIISEPFGFLCLLFTLCGKTRLDWDAEQVVDDIKRERVKGCGGRNQMRKEMEFFFFEKEMEYVYRLTRWCGRGGLRDH